MWINLALSACTVLTVLPGRTTFAQQAGDATNSNTAGGTSSGGAAAGGAATGNASNGTDAIAVSAAVLTNPAASTDQLDDAARKLVARHSPQSRATILQILNARPPAPRIALAKALADDPDSDTDFIDPLFVMMTTEQGEQIQAARALGSYKNNPALLLRLLDFSTDPRHGGQRIFAIKALGYMVDRRAAEQLVNLLKQEDEDPGVRGASAQSLGEMTGLNYGNDFARWQDWWNANQNKSADQFRLDVLLAKAVELDSAKTQVSDVQTHYQEFLDSEYQATAPDQQASKLLSYLTAPNDPVMRQMGAEIVRRAKLDGHSIPQQALDKLPNMIGDSDPHVRQAVVDALQVMNDRDALEPLLEQLHQEEDPSVRASIAAAFGPIGSVKAVGQLLDLLNDRTPAVAVAAAKSLADLAPALHTTDPATASKAAKALQTTLENTSKSGMQSLREAVVGAMAALNDPSLADSFRQLLNKGESVSVRRNALVGLGKVGNKNDDAQMGQFLDDPEASVREASIVALKDINAVGSAPKLVAMLKPNDNPANVQNAAWDALQTFLPEIDDTQRLANFADQFRDWNQWDRRLSCLKQLADDYQKDGKHEDDRADTEENIGQSQEQQQPPQYKEAAASYAAAMTIKEQEPGHNEEVISRLVIARLKAMLRAGDAAGNVDEAMAFAQQSMTKYPAMKGDIGTLIQVEAQRLKDAGNQTPAQLDNALLVIDGALKLNPALPEQYQYQLRQTKLAIQQMQARNKGTNGILYPVLGGETAQVGS